MELPKNVYLVRHGAYLKENLIERGMEEAFKAGQALIQEGFDHNATLLSSPTPRAVQTANVISNILGRPDIICKYQLGELDYVESFEEPTDAIRMLVEEEEIVLQPQSKLALITHEPLIAGLLPDSEPDIETGSVHKLCATRIPLLD